MFAYGVCFLELGPFLSQLLSCGRNLAGSGHVRFLWKTPFLSNSYSLPSLPMNFCNFSQWRDFLLITEAVSSFSGLSMTQHSTFYICHPFLNVINVGLSVLMEQFQMHVLLLISFASV